MNFRIKQTDKLLFNDLSVQYFYILLNSKHIINGNYIIIMENQKTDVFPVSEKNLICKK